MTSSFFSSDVLLDVDEAAQTKERLSRLNSTGVALACLLHAELRNQPVKPRGILRKLDRSRKGDLNNAKRIHDRLLGIKIQSLGEGIEILGMHDVSAELATPGRLASLLQKLLCRLLADPHNKIHVDAINGSNGDLVFLLAILLCLLGLCVRGGRHCFSFNLQKTIKPILMMVPADFTPHQNH